MRTPLVRVERLESRLLTRKCPTCYGHPTRIVTIDADTGEETGSNLPADGCPACGRPIRRELQIVGVAWEDMP
jgi:hypothetical protein